MSEVPLYGSERKPEGLMPPLRDPYRGTKLIRKRLALGRYSRPMPMILRYRAYSIIRSHIFLRWVCDLKLLRSTAIAVHRVTLIKVHQVWCGVGP